MTRQHLRMGADAVACVILILLFLETPFRYCHKATQTCFACKSAIFFDPPTRQGSDVLCSVHWEQMLLRIAVVLAVWWIVKSLLAQPQPR
jgi:hypothetical protein